MAILEYFLVSESVSIDQLTNRTSIFNVLEEIGVFGLPARSEACVAVSLWRAEEGDSERDFQATLHVQLPDEQYRDFHINFRITGSRHRLTQGIRGIPLTMLGELKFELRLNGETRAHHLVTVREASAQERENVVGIEPVPHQE